MSPEQINRALLFLLQHELSEDPRDMIANFVIKASGHLSGRTQFLGSLYLLSHGVIKAAIVTSLWRNGLWVYPAAIVFFLVFISYQVYRYTFSHSFWLIALTIFDVIIVVLTWIEYRHMKRERQGEHPIT